MEGHYSAVEDVVFMPFMPFALEFVQFDVRRIKK